MFDLLPYSENLDYLKDGPELRWPLPRKHFDPQLYFSRTLFSHGNIAETVKQQEQGYVSTNAYDYVGPENQGTANRDRWFRDLTIDDLANNKALAWGDADGVTSKFIPEAQALGSNTLLLNPNRGAMPGDQFKDQISRFAKQALPALQAHQVTEVTPLGL